MSVQQTSIDTFNYISNNGILGKMQTQVYIALYHYGPCTGSELFYKMYKNRNPSHSNIVTRLGELRDKGVAYVVRERTCTASKLKRRAKEWALTGNHPIKFEPEQKHICKACGGKGYIKTQQAKFDI